MSSQANKDQFLKQFEQIVEGIKQNRVKVCSPIVKPKTVTIMWGYLSFFCLPLSLLLSLPSFCLLRMIFSFVLCTGGIKTHSGLKYGVFIKYGVFRTHFMFHENYEKCDLAELPLTETDDCLM